VDKEPSTAKCWWCPYGPPREHLFKDCPQWKSQQGRRCGETGRGKNRVKIRDLFTGERCSQPILDFLASAGMGRRKPDTAGDGAQSEAPE